jgi:large repetitive protein
MRTTFHSAVALVAAFALSSCTMKEQQAPPLTGPSEFGTTLTVQITPDVLQLDGASQAIVTVTAYNEVGQPKRNVALRADIIVNGQTIDFGRLSARSLVTGADGRVTLTYTAPAVNAEDEAVVDINVYTIGDNHQNALARSASIRLVPTGIRVPPSDLVPLFTFSPSNPSQSQQVFFDAGTSEGSIAQYRWDFGDGDTSSGQTSSHEYDDPGTYHVRLTLTDPQGRSASTTQTISVGQGTAPVAQFAISPADPLPGDVVHFNGGASTAAPGRTIVSYHWDFGDGTSASGPTASKLYVLARTYNVTLTVTDDIGRTNVITKPVIVAIPDDDDGGQPAH